MYQISKEEADALRTSCRDVRIVRTMKKKSKRHHYFCDETLAARELLLKMREGNLNAGGLS